MISFIWLTDDKLLKFHHCSHKNAQNAHFQTLFEQDSAPAHRNCEMV